ncbi:Conidiation protein 6-domain-containing protein [Schizophyllum amplum]|uniref:Conidiation protein 6-domain-containing protein n=1 Tax=Schizophyllum amplum TaxID=97359 RepID=A0A550CZW0_9AGAR|nr:Conidiation protein 6-domain-containing protein [Auriculariopsis ampla]
MSQGKNPDRVAAGLKATINNPNVGEEAKDSASERLREMGADQPRSTAKSDYTRGVDAEDVDDEYVPGRDEERTGLSDYTEEPSRGVATGSTAGSGKDEGNVIRGYKATLHNPRVSDEAKDRAQEYLEEHGAA